jgi:hypothetical protein
MSEQLPKGRALFAKAGERRLDHTIFSREALNQAG